MKKLVIAGGSGFLGQACSQHFATMFEKIIVLTRGESRTSNNLDYMHWDAESLGPWASHINHCDVLLNLTGKSVDCRYTPKNKVTILNSRVNSTTILGKAIALAQHPPKLWLNSSTATIYRHSLDLEMCESQGEIGHGFSVEVARAWEKAFFQHPTPTTRKVALRTSIVLGPQGGAFKPLKMLVQCGLGGRQGRGNQKFSWIHLKDFLRSLEYIMEHETLVGPINIVAPQITTNTELMKTFRNALKRPWGIPLPEWLLHLGANIIGTETELVLKSRNVIPKILLNHGFTYNHPTLKSAIKNCLHRL
ncbi:TIGR01777 family oxidoreductase [Spongiimicrobium salis]|uniref:TIGR01777 family oxidoreductase n=1 Tax=Spongiimicrobium salis TaxID=1667022 RepID=UPI00374D9DD3